MKFPFLKMKTCRKYNHLSPNCNNNNKTTIQNEYSTEKTRELLLLNALYI